MFCEDICVSGWRGFRPWSQLSWEVEGEAFTLRKIRGTSLPQRPQASCPLLIHEVLLESFCLFSYVGAVQYHVMWGSVELVLTPRTSLLLQSPQGPHYSSAFF